jgi:hypothetical protein
MSDVGRNALRRYVRSVHRCGTIIGMLNALSMNLGVVVRRNALRPTRLRMKIPESILIRADEVIK